MQPQQHFAWAVNLTFSVLMGGKELAGQQWLDCAPSGTPKAVIARLHLETKKFGATLEMKQRLEAIGLEAADAGPDEFAALIRSEMQKWNKLVRDAGIKSG